MVNSGAMSINLSVYARAERIESGAIRCSANCAEQWPPCSVTTMRMFVMTRGHVLAIPRRHVADFFEMTWLEKPSVLALLDQAKRMVAETYSPDGFNIGVNIGKAAGRSRMHVHVHLIPRYVGDVPDPAGDTGCCRRVLRHAIEWRLGACFWHHAARPGYTSNCRSRADRRLNREPMQSRRAVRDGSPCRRLSDVSVSLVEGVCVDKCIEFHTFVENTLHVWLCLEFASQKHLGGCHMWNEADVRQAR